MNTMSTLCLQKENASLSTIIQVSFVPVASQNHTLSSFHQKCAPDVGSIYFVHVPGHASRNQSSVSPHHHQLPCVPSAWYFCHKGPLVASFIGSSTPTSSVFEGCCNSVEVVSGMSFQAGQLSPPSVITSTGKTCFCSESTGVFG